MSLEVGTRGQSRHLRLVLRMEASTRMCDVTRLRKRWVKESLERLPDCVRWPRADLGDGPRES